MVTKPTAPDAAPASAPAPSPEPKKTRAKPPMTISQQRFVLAIMAIVALLIALAWVGWMAAHDKADNSFLASVLLIISTVLGGAVTMAFHHLFPTKPDAADPPPHA